MAKESQIQWTDATWNIARGCTKVDADCKFCYMYRDSLNNTRYNPLQVVRTKTVFDMPLKYKETESKVFPGSRPLIFTCSLTDFFHESIDGYREEAWNIIRRCPHLIFQILTKRPERIMYCLPYDWGQGWENVWLGTSIGSEKGMVRLDPLLSTPAYKHFVSFEPLHEYIDMNLDISTLLRIDWAIIGGESGNDNGKYGYRPCKIEWMEEIASSISRVGNYVFIKQMGTHISKERKMSNRHGGNISEFPLSLQKREFPKDTILQY